MGCIVSSTVSGRMKLLFALCFVALVCAEVELGEDKTHLQDVNDADLSNYQARYQVIEEDENRKPHPTHKAHHTKKHHKKHHTKKHHKKHHTKKHQKKPATAAPATAAPETAAPETATTANG